MNCTVQGRSSQCYKRSLNKRLRKCSLEKKNKQTNSGLKTSCELRKPSKIAYDAQNLSANDMWKI